MLLIDDEVDFTELLAANLEDSGFDVIQINDPTKTLARRRKPFCRTSASSTWSCRCMDGGDVVSALKNDPELTHIPVLMLTALVEENPRQSWRTPDERRPAFRQQDVGS